MEGNPLETGVKVSIVVPVYNGHSYLAHCVDELRAELTNLGYDWELLIAEDGSTDGTKELCRDLKERYSDVKFIQEDSRLGRGESLRRTLQIASGDVLVYCDVDMSTDPRHLQELIDTTANGADIVTGSRYLPGSQAERGMVRLTASLTYNHLVRSLLRSELSDHQCGFKAFKRQVILDLLPSVKCTHWFWDTEILIRAQRQGFRVTEIPVHWHESRSGKSTVRLARDVMHFFGEVLRLRQELYSKLSFAPGRDR